jgi:hypothetical protein
MANEFDNIAFPQGFWPEGFWPQQFWPAPLGRIADWIAAALDGQEDPDETLTLRIVRPGINDHGDSHFLHADVFLCGIEERVKTETTGPYRFATAIFKLYGVIRSLPELTAVDTMLSRIAETIRRLILAGNSGGRACDGLALNIDCPTVDFLPGKGFEAAEVIVKVKYYL